MNQVWSKVWNRIPLELIFWITAVLLLAFAEPEVHGQQHHFTLCPLANMGLDWCPGCGIGRSITQFLRGNPVESIRQHWFGIPALMIIIYRIVTLIKLEIRNKKGFKINYKEEKNV